MTRSTQTGHEIDAASPAPIDVPSFFRRASYRLRPLRTASVVRPPLKARLARITSLKVAAVVAFTGTGLVASLVHLCGR